MEDRSQEALKQYRLKIYNIYKARGAYILETDCGLKLYRCFEGSKNRAIFENMVKEYLFLHGYDNVDLFVRTIDDEIISEDSAGCRYIMKNWFWGEECNLKDMLQIDMACTNLARIHNLLKDMDLTREQLEHNLQGSLTETFEKRNRELKRVKGYIREKRQKNEFEILYMNYFDTFFGQGIMAARELQSSSYDKLMAEAVRQRRICHGNYNYHNIIMLKSKNEAFSKPYIPPGWVSRQPVSVTDVSSSYNQMIATTNFEKSNIGLQIYDLYQFIRKVMEKNDWDIIYGSSMIEAYDRVKPISKEEMGILYVLLLYPEKFWKITNYYYNGKKSWLSERNLQKLCSIGEQNKKKEAFLNKLASII